jgi:hypothetical protein
VYQLDDVSHSYDPFDHHGAIDAGISTVSLGDRA